MIPADDESASALTAKRLSHHRKVRQGNQAAAFDHRGDSMGGLDDHPDGTLIRLQEDLDFESIEQQLQRGTGAIVGDGRDDLLPAHNRGADARAISITIESAGNRAFGALCTNLLIGRGQTCQAHQHHHQPAVNFLRSAVAGSCRLLPRYALVHRVSLSLESPRQKDDRAHRSQIEARIFPDGLHPVGGGGRNTCGRIESAAG